MVLACQTSNIGALCDVDLNPLTVAMSVLLLGVPEQSYPTGVCLPSVASSEQAATRGPWTWTPKCTQKPNESRPLCVFTAAGFAQGRGISLLTDPSTAQLISQSRAFTNPDILAGINIQADSPPFVIQELPSRGKGVIANRTIERGDLIMAYTATNIFHAGALVEPDYHMLHTAVDQLPTSSRALWLDLATHSDGNMYHQKINTNTFLEEINGEEHYMIIPEVAVRDFSPICHSQYINSG
jgi:hypothetical protein